MRWMPSALVLAAALFLGSGGRAAAFEGEQHPRPAPPPAPHTVAKDKAQEKAREHARAISEHRKNVTAERQRHQARMKQLRQDRRRVDKKADAAWKAQIDRQLAAEQQRHRQWLREHPTPR